MCVLIRKIQLKSLGHIIIMRKDSLESLTLPERIKEERKRVTHLIWHSKESSYLEQREVLETRDHIGPEWGRGNKEKVCAFFTHIFVRLVYTHTSFLSFFLLKNMFSQILICGWIHQARTSHIYAKRQVSNCSLCKVYLSTDTGKQIPRDCVCLEIGVRRLRKQTKHFARNSGKKSFSSLGKGNSKYGGKSKRKCFCVW